MSHTPGPWRTRKAGTVVGIVAWRGDFPENSNYERICHNISSEANARLIAAAPDLLEALKWCAQFAYSSGNTFGDVDKVKSAISKAEGQS